MAPLLRALPFLVLAVAAIDSTLVRWEFEYRSGAPGLFPQTALLWLVFGSLACVPARVTLAVLARLREPASDRARIARAVGVLAFWMLFPVVGHGALNEYTGVGQNVAALAQAGPWIAFGGAVLVLFAVAVALGWLVVKAPPAWLAGLAGVGAVALGLFTPGTSRAEPDVTGAGDPPNVLLLVWDTVRAQNTTPYGYARDTTPRIAALAERAVVFEGARSASRFTFTSHLSMLSGQHPSDHGARLVDSRYRRSRAPHLAALLRERGYRTGAFVGTNVLSGTTRLDYGFEEYDDLVDPPVCDTRAWDLVHDLQSLAAKVVPGMAFNGRPHWFQDFQRPAGPVLDNALAWIQNGDERPWFCMINLYDAHWPYVPDAPNRERLVGAYDGPMDGFVFRSDDYPDGYEPEAVDNAHLEELYDAEIRQLDERVDAFLAELDLDAGGTAVVWTSDHGEAFGEAGVYEHDDIYEPQVLVPLAVLHPDPATAGRRVEVPSSGVDVAPTILGLVGAPVPEEMVGVDLLELEEELDAERLVLVEDRDHVDPTDIRLALYRGDWKLVTRGVEDERTLALHDLSRDPIGELDLAADHPEVVDEMVELLEAYRGRWGGAEDDLDVPEGAMLNSDALKALGYGGDSDED